MGRKINLVSNQVKETIEEYIAVNELRPHDKLPSERSMCEMWNVNRVTLRGALSYLVDEGVLYLIPNNGYYVAPAKFIRNIQKLSPFKTEVEDEFSLDTKLLSYELIEANKELAQIFSVLLGSKLHKIVRLKTFQSVPLDLEEVYIPAYILPDIQTLDLSANSFYSFIEKQHSDPLAVKKEELTVDYAAKEILDHLDLPINSYVMKITSYVLDVHSITLEYSITYSNVDRCVFCCDLT